MGQEGDSLEHCDVANVIKPQVNILYESMLEVQLALLNAV